MAAVSYICRRNIILPLLGRNVRLISRPISTSEKKNDTPPQSPSVGDTSKKIPDFSKPLDNKNWVSYGFATTYIKDRYYAHFFMFILLTVLICGGTFLTMYYPDRKKLDWARREAYIKLHERERNGLEAIDKNYIDPSLIILPNDEDIGENEIII